MARTPSTSKVADGDVETDPVAAEPSPPPAEPPVPVRSERADDTDSARAAAEQAHAENARRIEQRHNRPVETT